MDLTTRRLVLDAEYAKAQQELARLAQAQQQVSATALRIEGALALLQELAQEPRDADAATTAPEEAHATAGPAAD